MADHMRHGFDFQPGRAERLMQQLHESKVVARPRVAAMVDHYAARPALWTSEGLTAAANYLDAFSMPAFIADLDEAVGGLPMDQLRPVVSGLFFESSSSPLHALPRGRWLALFERVGYTVGGEPAARPAEPLRLWRGASAARRDNWSWIDDPWMAEGYAAVAANIWDDAGVWTAVVDPWRLLAALDGGHTAAGRIGQARWYVVNTDGLTMTEATR